MDLALVIPHGRPALQLEYTPMGELTLEDAKLLLNVRGGLNVAPLKRLSDRHHNVARALASGMQHDEVASIYGYSRATITILVQDPAFKELMSFYSKSDEYTFRSTQERLSNLANDAIDLVQEKLEDEEERKKISIGQALEIGKFATDRSGNGPQSSSVSVNVNLNLADRLRAARERARAAMVDITPQVAAE